MVFRQLSAACYRSSGFSSNWSSFSASAKVPVETGGPTSGDVPKAGGAPAGAPRHPASVRSYKRPQRPLGPMHRSESPFAILPSHHFKPPDTRFRPPHRQDRRLHGSNPHAKLWTGNAGPGLLKLTCFIGVKVKDTY